MRERILIGFCLAWLLGAASCDTTTQAGSNNAGGVGYGPSNGGASSVSGSPPSSGVVP